MTISSLNSKIIISKSDINIKRRKESTCEKVFLEYEQIIKVVAVEEEEG